MTSLFALRALLFAGDMLAGSAVIMCFAWLFAARRSASARHLCWLGAFGASLALPILAAIVPSLFHILLSAPPRLPVLQTFDATDLAALPPSQPSGFSFDPPAIVRILGAIWLLGVIAVALRFAVATLCVSALGRRSRPFALPPQDLPRVAATHRECELRISDAENGPVAWGLLRPVILLPKSAILWPRDRLHAVLLHELAHIRRRDALAQALSHLVCALYWPSPLVWIGAKRLRREAEMAADDAVLIAGIRPSSYAGELLDLAAEFRLRQPALASVALFMAAPSALEARVQSVLAPTSLRSGVTFMDVMKIAGAGLVSAAAIAFACPSLAQETATQTPLAPPPAMAAPAAPEASPAPEPPPAPEAPPAPPSPPAEAVAPDIAVPHIHVHLDSRELRNLKHIDLRRVRLAVEKARREARVAVERARPEIERAVREAHVSEDAMRAIEAEQPEFDRAAHEITNSYRPEVEHALAEARPEIDRALAKAQEELERAHIDAKVQARVDAALKRAEIRIEAAQLRDRESRRDERSETRDAPEPRDTPDTPDEN